MKILFNPDFDRGYYLDQKQPDHRFLFNTKIVGSLGLLNTLERELGLSGKFRNAVERRLEYRTILGAYLEKNPSAFFAGSFKIDPAGVSGELLKCRDQLVFAGWHADISGISDKIDTLAEIEKSGMVSPGVEDRWINVLQNLLDGEPAEIDIQTIEVYIKESNLHPFYVKVLSVLAAKGVAIRYHETEYGLGSTGNLKKIQEMLKEESTKMKLDPDDKRTFQILKFKNETVASEFLATQVPFLNDGVMINRDNSLNDEIQIAFGNPASGSQYESVNPGIVQLLKLSSSLFFAPLNIQNLLSWLQVSVHPVPLGLRMNLVRVITKQGGIMNDDWVEAVSGYSFETDEKKDEVLYYLNLLKSINIEQEKGKIIQFYDTLMKWSQKRSIILEDQPQLTQQLSWLSTLSGALKTALDTHPEQTITAKKLTSYINEVYEPCDLINFVPQRNSIPVFSSGTQLISEPEVTVWLDLYNGSIAPTELAFLNGKEKLNLKQMEFLLRDPMKQVESAMDGFKSAFYKTQDRCILVLVEKHKDKVPEEHPVFSLLKARVENLDEFIIDPVQAGLNGLLPSYGWTDSAQETITYLEFPERQVEYTVEMLPQIPLREVESVSSMENLVQYPFDWVFQYGAYIDEKNTFQLSDVETTMGNVSHKLLELLLSRADLNTAPARQLMNDYDHLLDEVIQGYGACLLADEQRMELKRFRVQLEKSIGVLLDLIDENNLTVTGTEKEYVERVDQLNNRTIMGYLDLKLEDMEGSPVIFDLKWTRSPKRYKDMIKEGRSLQLAVYRALLHENLKREVSKTGYYLLSSSELVSKNHFIGENVIVLEGPGDDQILQTLNNSVLYRQSQLSNGILEEGEEQPLEELQYYLDQESRSLIPLRTQDKDKNKRKNYYSSYGVLKGKIQ